MQVPQLDHVPAPDDLPAGVLDRLPGMAYRGPLQPERPLWLASRGALELTGHHPTELCDPDGARYGDCIHPDDRSAVWRAIQDAVQAGRPFHLVYRLRTAGGAVRWVMDQGRARLDEAGRPAWLEGFVMDITTQRSRDAELRQAYKMDAVARLAGDVAEEFSAVLTTIKGYASMVSMGLPEQDPLREDLQEIEAAVDRATERTRHLLDFGKHPLVLPETVDVNQVAHAMEETLRHVVGAEVELVLSLAARIGKVQVHPSQMEQVLLNLVVNARDATAAGGRIVVETAEAEVAAEAALAEPGAHVALTVRDTGCGMDEPTLERIFEPFFTTKAEAQGAGIGLSVVYRIARQHGGTVRVQSAPGEGTTVEVLLPRVPEEQHLAGSAIPQWRGTVLVVDDDAAIRHYLRRVLEQCGLAVLEAASGEEGLQRASDHDGPLALVITDVVMPRMSGREFVRRLRLTRPATPVLFLSGYFTDAPRGDAFLTKPFSPQALWEKLRLVLGGGA